MNFYLIGTNNLATNKKTIRYKYRSHYKKYSLVGITSWAKKVGLHTLPRLIVLKCGGKLTVVLGHALIFLAGAAADEGTDARFHATSVKVL